MSPSERSQDTRQTLIDIGAHIMARKGFRAVGINEVLAAAGVPKGSFYHYFASKDLFGRAIMADYFGAYLADMDAILATADWNPGQRLDAYLDGWQDRQRAENFSAGCLIVTLGPEAANLSDEMRHEIESGVDEIISRIARIIKTGVEDGTMFSTDPYVSAQRLFDTWIGASVIAKIRRDPEAFAQALLATRSQLRIDAEPRPHNTDVTD